MDIEIFNEERLRYWCRRADIPSEGAEALAEVMRDVCADADLLRIFHDLHAQTTLRGEWYHDDGPLPMDPLVVEKLDSSDRPERSSLFYLLGYLAAMPYAEQEYLRRGISLDLFDETMWDIGFYYRQDSAVKGRWNFTEFGWIWHHLSCELFRLGRLQFRLDAFDWGVTAFRRKADGAIQLLADPKMTLRADGYARGAGGHPSPEASWRPPFEERPEGWYGCIISPYGSVLPEPVLLPREEWEVALRRGDTVLDLHIPRGENLTAEDCRESFRRAFDFFAWQYPERPFKACYCHTWFFTPQLQQILPRESSIVRFQREFSLFPYPGGPGFLWNFVFGKKYSISDLAAAPRDTSLRRAVLDRLARGEDIFDLPGVMFHSPEEWGAQPYMTRWDRQ